MQFYQTFIKSKRQLDDKMRYRRMQRLRKICNRRWRSSKKLVKKPIRSAVERQMFYTLDIIGKQIETMTNEFQNLQKINHHQEQLTRKIDQEMERTQQELHTYAEAWKQFEKKTAEEANKNKEVLTDLISRMTNYDMPLINGNLANAENIIDSQLRPNRSVSLKNRRI